MSYFIGVLGLTSAQVTALINRGGANGVAGLYACKTILNEHRPVCTYQVDLYGKHLNVTDNPDVWYPLADVGSISYASRSLTLTTAANQATRTRVVINSTAYPITANFLEATIKVTNHANGTGGNRYTAFGFASAFSSFPSTERAIFYRGANNLTYIGYRGGSVAVASLPIGREIATGDILTVRLDRVEGSANIDIARFYINGEKQYETTAIPKVNCYCGIGVYCDADVSTVRSVSIDYFGFRYVP